MPSSAATSTTSPGQALVVEDHPLYREALVNTVLGAGLGLQCRSAGNAAEARHLMATSGPWALALVDQRLPDAEGLRLLQSWQGQVGRRVLLTGQEEPSLVHQARQLGLSGFMPKTLAPDRMVLALRQVMAGQPWFPQGVTAPPPALTDRQLQVLRLVGRGRSNREIAQALGVAERTVKDHLSIVFMRLGAANRAEAVVQASGLGLLQFDSSE